MKKGFTLLELIIVIIILGILAGLGIIGYTGFMERSRNGEARLILGQLRTAQLAYFAQHNEYTDILTNLSVSDVPTASATGVCYSTSFYFGYSCATSGTCTATRCTSGGKDPDGAAGTYLTLGINGVGGGSGGTYQW